MACAKAPSPSLSSVAHSAAVEAIALSAIELPALPGDCYIDTAQPDLVIGEELAILLRRALRQIDLANDKRYRCVLFYMRLKEELARGLE